MFKSFLENFSFDAVGISLEFDSHLARTGLVSLDFKSSVKCLLDLFMVSLIISSSLEVFLGFFHSCI